MTGFRFRELRRSFIHGPKGAAFPPAMHFLARGRVTSGVEGKLVAEYRSPGWRLGKDNLGGSRRAARGLQQQRVKCVDAVQY